MVSTCPEPWSFVDHRSIFSLQASRDYKTRVMGLLFGYAEEVSIFNLSVTSECSEPIDDERSSIEYKGSYEEYELS